MQTQASWWARAAVGVRAAFSPAASGDLAGGMGAVGPAVWQRLFGRSPEILDVSEQVASEQRGRVALVARNNLWCRQLLAALRSQALTPEFTLFTREGFFTLVDLTENPAEGMESASERWPSLFVDEAAGASSGKARTAYRYDSALDYTDELMVRLADADLLLYLFDSGSHSPPAGSRANNGWETDDAHWYSRLRTLGAAMLPVAIVADPEEIDTPRLHMLRHTLGIAPSCVPAVALVPHATLDGSVSPHPALNALVERMLALRPRLAMPLAQEVPFCRRMIAAKVIRTGALMAALVGAEPIPLLDLPLHVAVQWKVAMQVAAIYGRPGLDVRSGEMAGTLSLSLLARTCAQQSIKLVPGIGWLLSSALSAVSALLLGHSLVRVYEQDRLFDLKAVRSVTRYATSQAAKAATQVVTPFRKVLISDRTRAPRLASLTELWRSGRAAVTVPTSPCSHATPQAEAFDCLNGYAPLNGGPPTNTLPTSGGTSI